eukprot:scaffold15.g4329.t1
MTVTTTVTESPAGPPPAEEVYRFPRVDPNDASFAEGRRFHWVASGEPHMIRRRELLAKYGDQIRKLYGYDHQTAWVVTGVVLAQFALAWWSRSWSWGWVLLTGWLLSGTLNQNLFTAQHEVSHFLAFRSPNLNRLLALFANLPLIIPVAVKFREYHHDHHLFLGVDGGDVDLPTAWEAKFVRNKFTKLIFNFVYLCIYGARPLLVRPKPFSTQDLLNWLLVVPFDLAVLYWGGHLLAEHYMFEPGQETYSYYGPLNLLSYNVGYHNEHHDFPQIPHTRLYRLRQIAPEYYNHLRAHTSWCWVLWRFLVDPSIGPWSRVHRLRREASGAPPRRGGSPGGDPAADAAFVAGGCKQGTPLGAVPAPGAGDATATVTLGGAAPKGGAKRRSGRNSENEPPAN